MNSIGPIFRRQNVLRSTTAMFVVSLLCLASYPDIAAAQASKAIPLLGKFAMAVVSGVATNFVWSKVADAKPEPEPKSPPKKPSPPPKAPPEPQISGYKFTLKWDIPDDGVYLGGAYWGRIVMRGMSGSIRVTTPAGTIIDQDMTAYRTESRNQVLLKGSNPRYAAGSKRLENESYEPDSFRLVELTSGDWTIADICYGNQCGPVQVIDADTFYENPQKFSR